METQKNWALSHFLGSLTSICHMGLIGTESYSQVNLHVPSNSGYYGWRHYILKLKQYLNFYPLAAESHPCSHSDETLHEIAIYYSKVTIDGPLLSPEQRSVLNPLLIDVKFVCQLPPLPKQLSYQHKSPYISYEFPSKPRRTREATMISNRSRDFAWDDVHVIFTNHLHETRLREIFMGPPLKIEVHDRDRISQDDGYILLQGDIFNYYFYYYYYHYYYYYYYYQIHHERITNSRSFFYLSVR